ncbi:hypothetical protein AB1Y20_006442 [Prymnesium parvum]|uniref:DUF202 domain-containing protein n=1 Tax=Prymnesium parvum TaxID=97485 RepID=A0AB34IYH8_PRYPA|mmetsp:Transcript_38378/g.95475  ORF Transcript_38378/g.95475 Transcript_38378/m.95475 type:complete len:140 (+) Transcript_38378:157-576(+)
MSGGQIYYNINAVVLSPMKLTPRAWLACERTLLSWLHLATILAAASTGTAYYHSYSPALHTCAILLMAPAIMFIFYACRVFYVRMAQMSERRLSSYDDRRGAFFLTVMMCAAVLLNLVRQLWIVFATPGDTFDYAKYST